MMSHRRFPSSAGLAATLLLCCLQANPQTSSTPPPKPGTISGRVVTESGRPLPGANVTIMRVGSTSVQFPEVFQVTSDHEGKFEQSGLKQATYRVMAFLQVYVPQSRAEDDPHAGIYRVGDFVTLVLTKGGVITGRVTNQEGEPIVGIRVRALAANPAGQLHPFLNPMALGVLTDDRGIYRIYGVPEATYFVAAGGSATYMGGGSNWMEIDPFDTDVPTFAPASTRDTAQEVTVQAGTETSNVDIQYRGGPGHAVSGSARGPKDDPALTFGVTLAPVNGPHSAMMAHQRPGERGFIFNAVDDGDYYITAVSYRQTSELMFSPPKRITIKGADVTGIALEVQPFSSVEGRVLLEELKAPECSDKQHPVFTETLVSLQGGESRIPQIGVLSLGQAVNTDERGKVSLKFVPAGRYYFNVQHFAKDWYLKSLLLESSGKAVDAARGWTTLKPGDQLNGLTITLAQGAASLLGQVAVREGETLPAKSYLYLVPAEKEHAENPLRYYVATVTSGGKVSLGNVAPGRYFALAQAATADSVATLLGKLRSPGETSYRSALRGQAETAKHDIELKPCQKLTDLSVRLRD